MGPILPQINVIAKQLGISPDVMGFVTSVLPLVYMPAKPAMGYVIDYFPVRSMNRKRMRDNFRADTFF